MFPSSRGTPVKETLSSGGKELSASTPQKVISPHSSLFGLKDTLAFIQGSLFFILLSIQNAGTPEIYFVF